jgi:glycosyltransferase involved in cell wall biosynthesis
MKKVYPEIEISILAPHNGYGETQSYKKQEYYDEYRFHYFWPFRWEKLTGRGIQPALRKNKLLYIELPFLFIAEFFATWRMVRKLKPGLLYAHWFTPQAITGALVAKITKVPFVFDTQASDAIVLKNVPFSKKIVASVCRQARAYTAPSQQTIDKLLYFATNETRDQILSKLHRIPYGTAPVEVDQPTVKEVEEKYGLKGKKMIYFIGRLVDRKGLDILIDAFAALKKSDDSLKLVIVGDGQERERFVKQVSGYGLSDSVVFAGYLNGKERFALLELASVCAIPSVNVGDQAEGLPVVFMEALTRRKAAVITDATGAHEIVQDGKNAFVAKAGSVEELQQKLQAALQVAASQDPAFYKAVQTLAEEFQWPAVIKRRYGAFVDENIN